MGSGGGEGWHWLEDSKEKKVMSGGAERSRPVKIKKKPFDLEIKRSLVTLARTAES